MDTLPVLTEIIDKLPSVELVLVVKYSMDDDVDLSHIRNAIYIDRFLSDSVAPTSIHFEQLPFDHPVYIMYSSGTTGLPKCLVQGPGVLLNHLKEHMLVCLNSTVCDEC